MNVMQRYKLVWLEKHNISLPILFYLIASELLSTYALWIFFVVSVIFIVFCNGGLVKIKNKASTKLILLMFAIGLISSLFTVIIDTTVLKIWNYIRDIIKMSAIPLVCIICASLSNREKHDKKVLYSTLFLFCSLYGIGSMLLSIPSYIASSGSLYNFEGNLINQWVVAVGVFLAFCKSPYIEKYYINYWFDLMSKIGLSVLAVISFSRTVFVLALCLFLPFFYNKLINLLKALTIITLAVLVVWSAFPNVANAFSNKLFRSFTEAFSSNVRWSNIDVVSNWRGYEVYCAQNEFINYTFLEKLFGKGFGATVDAKGYAKLVTTEDTLPYLHNGYYTTLIKMGLVGVCLNIGYWVMLLKENKRHTDNFDYKVCMSVIFAMACSMLIIHGVFWGGVLFVPFLVLEWD